MAIRFKETDKIFSAIQNMLEREEKIADRLRPFDANDADGVLKLRDELKRSWLDFSSEERKLNIAVVGRVKAGKSTFLNAVIFGGKHVLPEAFTPKTATLTKIEYAAENSLDVEFYGATEWHEIELLAQSSDADEATRAAKELVQAVRNGGIDTAEILSRGRVVEKFSSEDELAGRLNPYVGEDGKFTALVKCVTLRINKAELEGISIVDTPGLNDPVISRTQKTRDFLGLCDVVFFLSPASQFLDQSDVALLRAQLPQKGVARLILICSRFDEGLADVVFDADGLQEALTETKRKLTRQADKIFSKQIADGDDLAKILGECRSPLFVSPVVNGMIGKARAEYNETEETVFDNLNYHGDFDEKIIASVGDLAPVNERLREVIAQKDSTLARKAEKFVPLAEKNLVACINGFKIAAQHKLNQLANNDKAELERQQRAVASRINLIKSRLEEYFGEVFAKIERLKLDILNDLRRSSRDYEKLSTRTGYDIKTYSFRVSDSKWYNPFSWGKSHREYGSYQTRYTYIDTNDALEKIRNYAREAATSIETGFVDGADLSNLKRRLLSLIVDVFDAGDENFDPAYFRLLTERTLNKFELPVIKIDVSEYLNSISARFSGELRDASARTQIQKLLSELIAKLFDGISDKFTAEILNFKQQTDSIKNTFADKLLADINKEFDLLKVACAHKTKNIESLQEYIAALESLPDA